MSYFASARNTIKEFSRSQVARNSLYNFIGFALSSVLILVFTPLLVRRMGTEEYGVWIIACSMLAIMGIFDMGIGAGVTKYVAEYSSRRDPRGLSSVVTGALILYILIGVTLTASTYYFVRKFAFAIEVSAITLPEVSRAIRTISFAFIPVLFMGIAFGVATGLQRYGISSTMFVTRTALVQATALLVVLLGGNVYHVVIGNVLALWIVALAFLLIATRMLRPYGLRFLFSWNYGRKLFSFSGYGLITGMGSQIFNSVDRLAVGHVLGLSYVTYYAVCTSITKKLLQMAAVTSHSLMPATSSTSVIEQQIQLRSLFLKGIVIVSVLSLSPGILLLIISKTFLQLWMGTDFMNHSLSTFRILILAYAVVSLSKPAYYIVYGMGAPWICAIGGIIGGLATIFLIIILGDIWSLNGVALAKFGYITTHTATAYLLLRMKRHNVSSS